MILLTVRARFRTLPLFVYILISIFALVGFFFTAVFIGSQLHIFNASGLRDSQFAFVSKYNETQTTGSTESLTRCVENTLAANYPYTAIRFREARALGFSLATITKMTKTVLFSLPESQEKTTITECLKGSTSNSQKNKTHDVFAWAETDEWAALQTGLQKEEASINEAARVAGVAPRKIVAVIVSEQMRLFTSNRALFKELFGPLRVLGTQTQFSMGVTGFKPETATIVENNLRDKNSPYYLGVKYEHLLDYPAGTNHDSAQFERFADYNNHHWSYLYTALLIKQLETQWAKAGHSINDRPEIIATLFNIGFKNSQPKENPEVGGAEIEISGIKYSFGRLSYEFYYSGILAGEFPIE